MRAPELDRLGRWVLGAVQALAVGVVLMDLFYWRPY